MISSRSLKMISVLGVSMALVLTNLPMTIPAADAALVKGEGKCAGKLGKGSAKLSKAVIGGMGKCRLGQLSGKVTGACPDAKTSAKITKATNKLISDAGKNCSSSCSVSNDVPCITDTVCPPLAHLQQPAHELCSGVMGSNPFNATNLGFPGAYCESLLGHAVLTADDIGTCVSGLTATTSGTITDLVFGSIPTDSGLSKATLGCLSAASKGTTKLVGAIQKGVVKCRDLINKGKVNGNPATCTTNDAKLAGKIAKATNKLTSGLAKKCTDAAVTELDLCGQGTGAVTTVAGAGACLVASASEVTDSDQPSAGRTYSSISLIDAAYPPTATCGDGVVNKIPEPFLLLGEECDGDDDSACPGSCLPPGDVFECTCGNVNRIRVVSLMTTKDQQGTDLDSGWTGNSHNSTVANGAGYVSGYVSGSCDCSELDGNTCVGTTTDSICDTVGYQLPVCSGTPYSDTRCDGQGNTNGIDEDVDCQVCDAFSANTGDNCSDEGDCQAQCYAADGSVTGSGCQRQTDCATGSICRGQCDRDQYCIITPNGQPLPLSAGGSAVCVLSKFRQDNIGTLNIVTGEHENWTRLYSVTHLGLAPDKPCPVCGGFCEGGPRDTAICEGTCSTSGDDCRFDDDCGSGETCTTASADCPSGVCNLSLVCSGSNNDGSPCRIGAESPFGTISTDCLPPNFKNISGLGLEINFWPTTSEQHQMNFDLPCTDLGYENYNCPCPDDNGRATRPNKCGYACNAGPNEGQACNKCDVMDVGLPTTCEGGTSAGYPCDEDSDCAGGTCTDNPTTCDGTADACPGGICLPLCSVSQDDDEEGFCASGEVARCDGDGHEFRKCTLYDLGTQNSCEAGIDNVLGTVDDIPGAGTCRALPQPCFLPGVVTEGGDIFNGLGDPTNPRSSAWYCIGATTNSSINVTAGLGGPGRIRTINAVNVSNATSIPAGGGQ